MCNGTEVKINLTLIRHGKTQSNLENRYLGQTDEVLCSVGIEELEKKIGKYIMPDILFVSPLKRCIESAEILFPNIKQRVISEFIEIDFGMFERKNYIELNGDEQYQKWIDSNGTLPFPEGESKEDFIKRVGIGLKKMIAYVKSNFDIKNTLNICAVVHGGTIMALLHILDGGEYFSYQVKNTEGYNCSIICYKDRNILLGLEKL